MAQRNSKPSLGGTVKMAHPVPSRNKEGERNRYPGIPVFHSAENKEGDSKPTKERKVKR